MYIRERERGLSTKYGQIGEQGLENKDLLLDNLSEEFFVLADFGIEFIVSFLD